MVLATLPVFDGFVCHAMGELVLRYTKHCIGIYWRWFFSRKWLAEDSPENNDFHAMATSTVKAPAKRAYSASCTSLPALILNPLP